MKKEIKIGIISSKGGHLFQITKLKPFWSKYNHFWVTDKGVDSKYFLKKEIVHFGFFPDSRNLVNAINNLFLALKVLKIERPNVLLSGGAGIAVPFFIIGKIFFKTKLIFMEPYDFIKYPSLTGRIVYNFVDLFLIQHPFQKKWYPKAVYQGSVL